MLFNEPKLLKLVGDYERRRRSRGFSALQRAEIAEICVRQRGLRRDGTGFSALQRAEIAEIVAAKEVGVPLAEFQCSSTSRNC